MILYYDCKNSPILVILIKIFYMIQLIKICQPTTKRTCVKRVRLFGTHIKLKKKMSFYLINMTSCHDDSYTLNEGFGQKFMLHV